MLDISKFNLRAYGWQELAILYAPDLTPESAAKRLTAWVNVNPALPQALKVVGWRKGQRVLTPLQVRTIVDYIGEP